MSTRILLDLASTVAMRVTVMLGVAGLVYLVACWRRASAAHRHLIWSIALVASLGLPLFGSVLPPVRVPIPAAFAAQPEAAPGPSLGGRGPGRQQVARAVAEVPATVIHEAPAPAVLASSHRSLFSVTEVLLALYVGGCLILVAGIVRDHWLLSWLTREAELVTDEPWRTLLESLADRTGVRRRVKLLRAHAPVSPLTAGIIRPVIVIPSSAEEWSSARREAVLLHELAHVSRHDCLTQTLAAVACALYWPHPLAWIAAARLRVDRELACDDAVLARGIWARDYARDLLELARALSTPVPRLAVSMAGVGELEGRIRSLIDGARSRRAPSRVTTSVAIVGACVAGVLAAIVRPAPVAAAAPVQVPPTESRPLVVTPSPFGGQFAIRLTTPADGPEHQGRVHVMLWTPGINTFYSEMRELAGLTREQLLTEGAALQFALRRDAGTLVFAGLARHGTAEGQFSFEADTSFNRALANRGIAAITPEEQFSFARHNLSLAFLDELARLGYPTPTRRELVVAATSGADLTYLREMSALGYRARSLSALVALSNEGVDPPFVRRLSALGYRSLPIPDLLQLRNEDVDSSFIASANARAGRKLSVGELILRRLNRTESEPPAAQPIADDTVTTGRWMLHALSGGLLQLDIEWANVNQWRRVIRADDLTELEPNGGRFRLVQDAGVFTFEGGFNGGAGSGEFTFVPDKSFLSTLRSLGIRDADRIGIHQLKNLAFGFMSADSVRGLITEGVAPLTLHEVVDLAVYQITPAFVRQVKTAGYTDLTVRRLVDIKMGARVPPRPGA